MEHCELLCFVEMPKDYWNDFVDGGAIAIEHDQLRFGLIYNQTCFEMFLFREYGKYRFWKSNIILELPTNFISFKLPLMVDIEDKLFITNAISLSDFLFFYNEAPFYLKALRIRNSFKETWNFVCLTPKEKWNGRVHFSNPLIKKSGLVSHAGFYFDDYFKISLDWFVTRSGSFFSFIDVEINLNFFRKEILNNVVAKLRTKVSLGNHMQYIFLSATKIIHSFSSIYDGKNWKNNNMFMVDINSDGTITLTKIVSEEQINKNWQLLFSVIEPTHIYCIKQQTCLEFFERRDIDVL